MTDSLTELLADALLRFEDAKRSGTVLTPQQLCPDRPQLWPEIVRVLSTSPIIEQMLDTNRDSVPPAPGPIRLPEIPDYEVERVLGRGAMSVVYQAKHAKLRRRVALKVLRITASLDDEERARFQAEIKANARLQHANVVQIYEAGEHAGSPYLALEYVEGGNLREKLASGPLPPHSAVEIVRQLADAVHAAHTAGIVHRDLKPANVLLTPNGQPKVADFGLAKLRAIDEADTLRGSATHTGAILGTPTYMAPEQASGRTSEIGPATDIYALGAILYECLTGRPPFQAASMLDLLELIRQGDPASPRMLQPRLPLDLDTICMKCLSKEPARRYATASDLAEDLRRFQIGVPIHARPVSWIERAWKFTRRNAVLVGGVAATILALSVGLVGVGIAYGEQQRAKKRAESAEGDRRRADSAKIVQLAKVQMLSGRWNDALFWLDRALMDGVDDPLAVRFLRCQALLALNRPESADELSLLERHSTERPELVAQIQLWRGDMVLGRDDAAAEQLLQTANASGFLDEVDRAYVEGVLAKNATTLIDRLEFVVARQPNRLRANLLLGFTYFCLGKKHDVRLAAERVQTLHPDDSFVDVLHALVAALDMQQAEVDRRLARAAFHLRPDHFRVLSLICQMVARMANFDDLMHRDDQSVNAEIAKVVLAAMAGPAPTSAASEMQHPFPIPVYLKKAMLPLLQVLPLDKPDQRTMMQVSLLLRMPGTWVRFVEPLERITSVHPEGMLLVLKAMALKEANRWDEAETAIDEALRRPAIFKIEEYATITAIGIWHYQATSSTGWQRLFAGAKSLVALRMLRLHNVPLGHLAALAPVCLELKQFDLLRFIIRAMRSGQAQDRQAQWAIGSAAYQAGMWLEALPILEGLQKSAQGNERKLLDSMLDRIRTAVRKAIGQ
jgi:tRNA A-37 threonylcarbamoyl transferase component Bud32/tetratricopeptide (TPR) repeat protein